GAVEHGQVLILEEGSAFKRHRPAGMDIRSFHVFLREAERRQDFEGEIVELLIGNVEGLLQPVSAERPLVEDELDVESLLQSCVDSLDLLVGEAFCLERGRVYARSLIQVAMSDGIGLDLGDL